MTGVCARGCGRPVKIRGYCNAHYQARRTKWVRAGIWQPLPDVTGARRRLQGLVAIGWPPSVLASRIGMSRSTFEHIVKGHVERTSSTVVAAVCDLYEELSGTPGSSDRWRRMAADKGWVAPLAWDDDSIDDPDATPHTETGGRPSRAEEYLELRELGYGDRHILARWGIKPTSLVRLLDRAGIPQSPGLKAYMRDRQSGVAS